MDDTDVDAHVDVDVDVNDDVDVDLYGDGDEDAFQHTHNELSILYLCTVCL